MLKGARRVGFLVGALCALTMGVAAPDTGKVDVAKATELARRIVAAGRAGQDTPVVRRVKEQAPGVSVWKELGSVTLDWEGASFDFSSSTGQLREFRLALHWQDPGPKPGMVDSASAEKTAWNVYRAITGNGEARLFSRGTGYCFHFTPVVKRYDFDGFVDQQLLVSALGGEVWVGNWSQPPEVEVPTGPLIDASEARAVVYRELGRLAPPVAHIELSRFALQWCVPDIKHGWKGLTDRQIGAAKLRRALLAYCARLQDPDVCEPWTKGFTFFASVCVDPQSGQPMDVSPFMPLASLVGETVHRNPLAWSTEPADGVLYGGDKPTKVPGCLISASALGFGPTQGDLYALEFGSTALMLYFDSASGLVWLERGEERLYGSPNAALLKALRCAKPLSTKPFGKARAVVVGSGLPVAPPNAHSPALNGQI